MKMIFGNRSLVARALALGAALTLAGTISAGAAETPPEPAPPKPHSEYLGYTGLSGNYLAGRFAYRQRDVTAAADFYREVLKSDLRNRALVQRALVLTVQDGRVAESIPLARHLVELDPQSKIGHLILIVGAVAEGRLEEALARVTSVERGGIYELMAPILEGWLQIGRGDYDAALAAIEPIAAKQAFEMYHAYHRALMAGMSGHASVADENFRRAATAVPGGTLRVVSTYATFLLHEGRRDEAMALYEAFRENNPDSPWLDPLLAAVQTSTRPELAVATAREGIAEALFGAASALPNENAGDTGLIYANLALHLRPDFPVVQLLVGEILDSLGRYEAAIDSYRGIPKGSSFSWSARLRAASNLASVERIDEAFAILGEMVDERPVRSDAAIALADVLRRAERYAEAVTYYDIAIERTGEFHDRHWTLFYSRGVMLERIKQWPRAEADFLKALELQPDQPLVLNYLGYSWVEQGINLERAMELIERAVALRPTDGYIVDSLGWAFYRLGEYQKAVKHLERAVELRADDPIITDHLGDIYWRVGRELEARFQWERALVLGAEDAAAAIIRKKLEEGLADGAEEQQ
jgi:tetratricopeptide (TPR) repeat protein